MILYLQAAHDLVGPTGVAHSNIVLYLLPEAVPGSRLLL